jgi:hypothetical protein
MDGHLLRARGGHLKKSRTRASETRKFTKSVNGNSVYDGCHCFYSSLVCCPEFTYRKAEVRLFLSAKMILLSRGSRTG